MSHCFLCVPNTGLKFLWDTPVELYSRGHRLPVVQPGERNWVGAPRAGRALCKPMGLCLTVLKERVYPWAEGQEQSV